MQDVKISYPCIMLNVMLVDHNTNDQYQELVDAEKKVCHVRFEALKAVNANLVHLQPVPDG